MSSLFKIDKNLYPTSIFPYLGPFGTALCASTCKFLRTQASSERLWEYFFKMTFKEASKPYNFTYQHEYGFLQTRITINISRRVFLSVNCKGFQDGLGSFTISHFQIDWQGRIVLADIQGGRAMIFIPPPKGQTSWKRLPIAIGRPMSVHYSLKGELIAQYENGIQKTFTFKEGQFAVITDRYEHKESKKEDKETSPVVATSPGGKTIFSGDKNELAVCRKGNKVYTLTDKEQVRFVHFTEDGKLFVICGENRINIMLFCIPYGAEIWKTRDSLTTIPDLSLQEAVSRIASRFPYYEGLQHCQMSLLEIAEEFARLCEENGIWTNEFLLDQVKVLPLDEQEQIYLELVLLQNPSLSREVASTKTDFGFCSFYNVKALGVFQLATNAQRGAAIFNYLSRKAEQTARMEQLFLFGLGFF